MPGQPIQIKIIGSNSSTGELTFSNDQHTNNGHTEASRGDLIIWHVNPGSGVDSITAIGMKPSPPSTNIFMPGDPHALGSSANWQGTINPATAINAEYNYEMTWSGTDGTTNNLFDPTIRVKP